MPLNFPYGIVEAALKHAESVPTDRIDAFRARLRQIKRAGFPEGVNTGKGRHVRYGARELVLLAIALELIQLGQSTEEAVAIARESAELIRDGVRAALETGLKAEDPSVFLGYDPAGLVDGAKTSVSLGQTDIGELSVGGFRRIGLINLTSLLHGLIGGLFIIVEGAEAAFREALNEWALEGEVA